MKTGDRIVYYASGIGLVFTVGTVTSYPYRLDEAWSEEWQRVVNVKLNAMREYIHDGVPLEALNAAGRELRSSIKRRSHIRLLDPEYERAVELLR